MNSHNYMLFARQKFSKGIQHCDATLVHIYLQDTFISIVTNFSNPSVCLRVQVESMMPNSCQLIIEKQNMAINVDDDFSAATNDVNEDRRCLKKLKPLLGIGIVAVSALFFCISNVIVKKLSHVDFFMISCIRFFIIFMMSSPVLMSRVEIKNHPAFNVKFKSSPFPAGKRWLLFWRSILGASNLMIHFYSVQVIL